MTAIANLSFRLGDDWVIDLPCDDTISTLTGATVEWRLASVEFEPVLKAMLIVGQGITVIDEDTKTVRIAFTAARQATANVTPGLYEHEAWVYLASDGGSIQMAGTLEARESLKVQFPTEG